MWCVLKIIITLPHLLHDKVEHNISTLQTHMLNVTCHSNKTGYSTLQTARSRKYVHKQIVCLLWIITITSILMSIEIEPIYLRIISLLTFCSVTCVTDINYNIKLISWTRRIATQTPPCMIIEVEQHGISAYHRPPRSKTSWMRLTMIVIISDWLDINNI